MKRKTRMMLIDCFICFNVLPFLTFSFSFVLCCVV